MAAAAHSLPALPARASYLFINNAKRRNALSLETLSDLRAQLIAANLDPKTGRLLLLPEFKPWILPALARLADKAPNTHEPLLRVNPLRSTRRWAGNYIEERGYGWLVSSRAFAAARQGLPAVLVLASDGPVFSAGHDLRELRELPAEQVRQTFALCAEVMALLRRSTAIVVSRIQGLATAAGAQLALSADLPFAVAGTPFRLPGAALGLPCTSPSTIVSRRVGNARGFRMMALAESWRAEDLGGAVDVVEGVAETASMEDRIKALDKRMLEAVSSLVEMPAQPAALGKWAYWTQTSFHGHEWAEKGNLEQRSTSLDPNVTRRGHGGDGYEDAVEWAGKMMALYAKCSEDAREGMAAFIEKRKPVWVSNGDGVSERSSTSESSPTSESSSTSESTSTSQEAPLSSKL